MVSVWAQSSGSADLYVGGLLEADNLSLPFYWRAYYREAPLLVAVKVYSGNNSWLVIPSITSLNLFESWKCINREESDWHKLSFRDSHWENVSLKLYQYTSTRSPVYCRRVIGEYRPTQNTIIVL